jgi:hypothetical protein
MDDAGITGLPAVRAFIVKTQPVPPLYQFPAPGAVVPTGTGALQCTEVTGARWYRLQVATDAAFSQIAREEARADRCRLSLEGLPKGDYFWRAASVADTPTGVDQGPFAPPQPFTLSDAPPAMSAQSMDADDGGVRVSLNWPGQPGQRFRLQLAKASEPEFDGAMVQDVQLDRPAWAAGELPAGEYLVRIQVIDPSGLQSGFSPARKVRVGTGLSTGYGLPVAMPDGNPVQRP